jgi:hypothetical protein
MKRGGGWEQRRVDRKRLLRPRGRRRCCQFLGVREGKLSETTLVGGEVWFSQYLYKIPTRAFFPIIDASKPSWDIYSREGHFGQQGGGGGYDVRAEYLYKSLHAACVHDLRLKFSAVLYHHVGDSKIFNFWNFSNGSPEITWATAWTARKLRSQILIPIVTWTLIRVFWCSSG